MFVHEISPRCKPVDIDRLDLLAQFLAVAEPSAEWLEYVKRSGINTALAVAEGAVLAVAGVQWTAARRFSFDPRGMRAAICTALDEYGDVIDLVAWAAHRPDKFASALGTCTVLGRAHDPDDDDRPTPIWKTPLRWLQAGCRGAVVVDPLRAGLYLGGAHGSLIGEDASHAHELSRLLHRQVTTPTAMPATEMRVAA